MKALKYILASVILVNVGNFLVKYGFEYGLKDFAFRSSDLISGYTAVFTTPFIVLGILSTGISSIFWLAALSKADLSYAYPMISIGYITTAVMSWLFFNENLTMIRLSGICIICIGVFLMSKSEGKK